MTVFFLHHRRSQQRVKRALERAPAPEQHNQTRRRKRSLERRNAVVLSRAATAVNIPAAASDTHRLRTNPGQQHQQHAHQHQRQRDLMQQKYQERHAHQAPAAISTSTASTTVAATTTACRTGTAFSARAPATKSCRIRNPANDTAILLDCLRLHSPAFTRTDHGHGHGHGSSLLGVGTFGTVHACQNPGAVVKHIAITAAASGDANTLLATREFAEVRSFVQAGAGHRSNDPGTRFPHVIGLLSWGFEDGVLELRLERCHHGDLQTFIKAQGYTGTRQHTHADADAGQRRETNGGLLPLAQVRDFTRGIARGIMHLHQHGLIHCDIKPSNILIANADPTTTAGCAADFPSGPTTTTTGARSHNHAVYRSHLVAKIGDLGSAVPVSAGQCISHGTARYQAPEAVFGHTMPKSDVFGAGATVYYMATSHHPFAYYSNEGTYFFEMGMGYCDTDTGGLREDSAPARLLSGDIGSQPRLCGTPLGDLVTAWMRLQAEDRPSPAADLFLRHPFLACKHPFLARAPRTTHTPHTTHATTAQTSTTPYHTTATLQQSLPDSHIE